MAGKRKPERSARTVPVYLPPHVEALLGQEAALLLDALGEPVPTSIRLNPAKPVAVQGALVPWCEQGRYLEERPVFTLDPLLHAGAYYVHEAASMLLEQAVKGCGPLPDDAVVLDLCAAPGGKATHLAALMPPEGLLVANETVPARQVVLTENLWKWGRPNTLLVRSAPEQLAAMGALCDLVVVDAPCSGEGMFRKDPHARAQWGENLVETCARRQEDILDQAWILLKPGGYLVYSTCTWETRENEDQVRRLVEKGAERVALPVKEDWGVVSTDGGWRCYPHRTRGEGFFISMLRKPGQGGMEGRGGSGPRATGELPDAVRPWLHAPEQLATTVMGDELYAIDRRWAGLALAMADTAQVTSPGTPVAVRKGRDWVPHPALATNMLCRHEAFRHLDLDREQAVNYLRGGAIPAQGAAGIGLVRYQGLGLGWVQGAGNRWNNRWPAPWRIRMG